MRTLIIIYSRIPLNFERSTIKESIYAFKKHLPGKVFYVNLIIGYPFFLNKLKFDLIIFHYSFLAIKYSDPLKLVSYGKRLSQLNGYKIALPQDEYINSFYLNQFFLEVGIDHLFTLFYDKKDITKVYPKRETGISKISTILPGYVDNFNLKKIDKILPFNQRKIDLSYRARKNPFWLGEFSIRKWKIAEEFLKLNVKDLIFDISTKEKDTIYGKDWHKFIENSKFFLGVEGGASFLDPKGITRSEVEKFTINNSEITFDLVENLFLSNKRRKINYKQLTPRIFEAISRKACLVLMEGFYNGILIPNKHYIPVKEDFSNLEYVIRRLRDIDGAKKMIENTYNDIILSGKYSYESFVKLILNEIKLELSKPTAIYDALTIYIYYINMITTIKSYIILIYRKIRSGLNHLVFHE